MTRWHKQRSRDPLGMPAAENPQEIFRASQEVDAADAGCIGTSADAAGAEKTLGTQPVRRSQRVCQALEPPTDPRGSSIGCSGTLAARVPLMRVVPSAPRRSGFALALYRTRVSLREHTMLFTEGWAWQWSRLRYGGGFPVPGWVSDKTVPVSAAPVRLRRPVACGTRRAPIRDEKSPADSQPPAFPNGRQGPGSVRPRSCLT